MHPFVRRTTASVVCAVAVGALWAGSVSAANATSAVSAPTSSPEATSAAPGSAGAVPAPRVISADEVISRTKNWLVVDAEPGADLTVKNVRGEIVGHTPAGSDVGNRVAFEFDPRLLPSDRRFTVTQTVDGVTSPATPFHRNDTTIAKPGQPPWPENVTASIDGRIATVEVENAAAAAGSSIQLGGSFGQVTAEKRLVNGKATFSFPAPTSETRYWVWTATAAADGTMRYSVPHDVTLLAGAGSEVPAPVTVEGLTAAGTRTIATVKGLPGAVVSITDDDDRVVASGRIGNNATRVQIVVPADTRAAGELRVSQTAAFVSSDSVPLAPAS